MTNQKASKARGVSFSVFLLVSCLLLPSLGWSQAASLDLSKFWMQDRFIRVMAEASTRESSAQLEMLNQVLDVSQKLKSEKIEVVEVKSLKEFEKFREVYFRSEGSLHQDVEKALSGSLPGHIQVTTSSPEVGEAFQKMTTAYQNNLDRSFTFPPKKWWTSLLSSVGVLNQREVHFFDLLMEDSKDSKLLVSGLKRLSDDLKIEQIQQFSSQIDSRLQDVDQLAEQALSSGKTHFTNPTLEKAARIILTEYFSALNRTEKLELAFAVLEKPEDISPLGMFRRIARKAGPQFQKFFQVVGRDEGFDPGLREIFTSFEQDLPAAPQSAVEEMLRELSQSKDFELLSFEKEPRQVGTMAQLHFARMRFKDGVERDVAVRLLKPGIKEKVQRENQVLDQVVARLMQEPDIRDGLASLPKLVEDIKVMALKETDVTATVASQKKAKQVYTKNVVVEEDGHESKVLIEVPAVYSQLNENVIVMEWVNGLSLDKVKKTNPALLKAAAETWVQTWLETTVFGGGFVHSDPHPGNILFRVPSNGVIEAWVIDYGMTGQVNEDVQKKFALLAIANVSNSASVLARTMMDLSLSSDGITAEQLTAKISTEQIRLGETKVQLDHWISFAIKNGLHFSLDVTTMGRGMVAGLRVLKESGSDKKIGDMVQKILKEHPEYIWKFRELPGLVSPTDLLDIGQGLLPKGLDGIKKSLGGLFSNGIPSFSLPPPADRCGEALKHKN